MGTKGGWRQWYMVAVLGAVNALSQCDRAGLSVYPTAF